MPKETKSYTAACVQFPVEKGRVADNLKRAEAGIREAHRQGAELMVLPELWPTSLVADPAVNLIRESREAERSLARLSEELEIMLVGGGMEEERGRLFNRSCIVDCGKVLGTYRKVHMFSTNNEHKIMTPGQSPLFLDTRLGRIGTVICYDIRFPELCRYYFHHGVQLLAVPAQWPEARANHWRTLVKARAIENQMFILGCNRTGSEESLRNDDTLVFPGDSRIVDPMGDELATAQGEEAPLLAEIQLRRCRSMQRIMPIHQDRQPGVYRQMWEEVWRDGGEETEVPEVPVIDAATPSQDRG